MVQLCPAVVTVVLPFQFDLCCKSVGLLTTCLPAKDTYRLGLSRSSITVISAVVLPSTMLSWNDGENCQKI